MIERDHNCSGQPLLLRQGMAMLAMWQVEQLQASLIQDLAARGAMYGALS